MVVEEADNDNDVPMTMEEDDAAEEAEVDD